MCLSPVAYRKIPENKYSYGYKVMRRIRGGFVPIYFRRLGEVLSARIEYEAEDRKLDSIGSNWDGGFYFYKNLKDARKAQAFHYSPIATTEIVKCKVRQCIAEDNESFVAKYMTIEGIEY